MHTAPAAQSDNRDHPNPTMVNPGVGILTAMGLKKDSLDLKCAGNSKLDTGTKKRAMGMKKANLASYVGEIQKSVPQPLCPIPHSNTNKLHSQPFPTPQSGPHPTFRHANKSNHPNKFLDFIKISPHFLSFILLAT